MHKTSANPPIIILVNPQMGENIGAAARVMCNFGCRELRLVAPRDGWPNPKAESMAAGTLDLLQRVAVYPDLPAALSGVSTAFAVSARIRDMEKPVMDPARAGALLHAQPPEQNSALVFGAEASGLKNEDITLCDAMISYPVAPEFTSLNLAQAVTVMVYEWVRQQKDDPGVHETQAAPAPKEQLIGLFAHLETELSAAGFFFPPEKTRLMKQNIRNTLIKARMNEQEVRTFRGLVRALAHRRGGQ